LTGLLVEISCARFSRVVSRRFRKKKFASNEKEREMKKFLTLVFAAVFGTVLLTGCTKKETTTTTETSTTEAPAVVEETSTTMTATTMTGTPAATTTTETTTTMTTTTTTNTP
jgi:outer membrane murein-binding lipoprotein Lpp